MVVEDRKLLERCRVSDYSSVIMPGCGDKATIASSNVHDIASVPRRYTADESHVPTVTVRKEVQVVGRRRNEFAGALCGNRVDHPVQKAGVRALTRAGIPDTQHPYPISRSKDVTTKLGQAKHHVSMADERAMRRAGRGREDAYHHVIADGNDELAPWERHNAAHAAAVSLQPDSARRERHNTLLGDRRHRIGGGVG
jgi:hypothetical protein